MNVRNSLLVSLFLLFHGINAFNITKILDDYPSFSTFNNYLTQTQLAGAINALQTLTVLVVDNSAMSPVSGKPADVLKKIMSVHVVLDYYDVPKLQKLSNKTAIMTTLFQKSGVAAGQTGHLNTTVLSSGTVEFGSAVPGSTLGADLVKSVASQAYNISVLQISNVIIPPGIDGSPSNSSSNSTTPPPSKSPASAPAPASSPPKPAGGPAPSADAPSNATAPAADAPAPTADAPAASPPKPVADAPAADAPGADTPAGAGQPPSAGLALRVSLIIIMIITFSTLCSVSMI